jgi:hypothetical protein
VLFQRAAQLIYPTSIFNQRSGANGRLFVRPIPAVYSSGPIPAQSTNLTNSCLFVNPGFGRAHSGALPAEAGVETKCVR